MKLGFHTFILLSFKIFFKRMLCGFNLSIWHSECINAVPFAVTPPVSLALWTSAYQWAKSKTTILQAPHPENGCRQYHAASSTLKDLLTVNLLVNFYAANLNWSSFDEYKYFSTIIWIIVINENDLNKSTCTCPPFLKRGKHCLGMKIRLKKVEVPGEAKEVPIVRKRKRGRPKKAKRAFIIDD